VVAACSYEARKFGIHSAMASSTAYKLCPDAVFIRPRFNVYKAVSSLVGQWCMPNPDSRRIENLADKKNYYERGQVGCISGSMF
jgi:nucleotidyltransferase/DNA polymerase involved in DNA repair